MPKHDIYVSFELIDAIKSFPAEKEILHCDHVFTVSQFDFYATCPRCEANIKIRSMAADARVEDVFEAVFEWLSRPGAKECFEKRQREILNDTAL